MTLKELVDLALIVGANPLLFLGLALACMQLWKQQKKLAVDHGHCLADNHELTGLLTRMMTALAGKSGGMRDADDLKELQGLMQDLFERQAERLRAHQHERRRK